MFKLESFRAQAASGMFRDRLLLVLCLRWVAFSQFVIDISDCSRQLDPSEWALEVVLGLALSSLLRILIPHGICHCLVWNGMEQDHRRETRTRRPETYVNCFHLQVIRTEPIAPLTTESMVRLSRAH